jgi:hypothetical protein
LFHCLDPSVLKDVDFIQNDDLSLLNQNHQKGLKIQTLKISKVSLVVMGSYRNAPAGLSAARGLAARWCF